MKVLLWVWGGDKINSLCLLTTPPLRDEVNLLCPAPPVPPPTHTALCTEHVEINSDMKSALDRSPLHKISYTFHLASLFYLDTG